MGKFPPPKKPMRKPPPAAMPDEMDAPPMPSPRMKLPPKKAPGFQSMSAPGNTDFGMVGASSPEPMQPAMKKKPRKITF